MLVRLLGFLTLNCGCVVGQYREVGTGRDVAYIEEKGAACADDTHRRNHSLTLNRPARVPGAFRTRVA